MTLYRRSKELGHVVRSLNEEGGLFCIDVFKRPDGTFGFEQYRRDPESGEGWYPVSFTSSRIFPTEQDAYQAAKERFDWL